MPKYFFTIRTGHEGTQVERAAELEDDAAALAYASELARELTQSDDCTDTSWPVKVSDETRPMVLAVPFLPPAPEVRRPAITFGPRQPPALPA